MPEYLNFEDGQVVEVRFPFDDAVVASNGKIMFTVNVGEAKMKLGVTPRAFEHVFQPALGASALYQADVFGKPGKKASYQKGQTLWVVKTGNNPQLPKTEAFKDPELTARNVQGNVFSTGTPYNFDAAAQGQPQPVQPPPSDASRKLPDSESPPVMASQMLVSTPVSRPSFNERLATLAEGYGRCLNAAQALAVDTDLGVEQIKDVATHFSMSLLKEGYYVDLEAELTGPPVAPSEPAPTEPPATFPAPSGPADDDLPF